MKKGFDEIVELNLIPGRTILYEFIIHLELQAKNAALFSIFKVRAESVCGN